MTRRNPEIDILRGLSILFVVLLHLNLRVPFRSTFVGSELPQSVYNFLFNSGFYGVCVFFAVSGFLITNSALAKWGSLPQINLRHFYLMRFARIAPLLILLLATLSLFHVLEIQFFTINEDRTSLGRAVLAALTFHINWLEIQVGYLPGAWDILWTLSIEETFYLFFPLVCLFIRNERSFFLLVAMSLWISPWARTSLYEGNPLGDKNHLAYIDTLFLGCLAALIVHRFTIPPSAVRWMAVTGWSGLLLVFLFQASLFRAGITSLGLNVSILGVSSALVLISLQYRLLHNRQRPIAGTGWLQWLGRNSYEIYLSHMFVVFGVVFVYRSLNLQGEWAWLLYPSVIMLAGALGEFLATYFSSPMNSFLRNSLIDKRPAVLNAPKAPV